MSDNNVTIGAARRSSTGSDRQEAQYAELKSRLDSAQLERTIAALHDALPQQKAQEAAATLRRMYDRARRWES